MLQAFVSLQPHTPPKTETGLKEFFEGLAQVTLSRPTIFSSNVDDALKPYKIDAIVQSAMHPDCKWIMIRGEAPFWHGVLSLPDRHGYGALFFYLEDSSGNHPSPDELATFGRKLYAQFEPRLIRIGDSEGRQILKSRHNLSMMPGFGRIDWLQIVHPSIYQELYNSSELEAAPAHWVEVNHENGMLFLQVYPDPKDWQDAETVSLANMVPAFLAGIVNLGDSDKHRKSVQRIEKLWTRAFKLAERSSKIAETLEMEAPGERPTLEFSLKESQEMMAATQEFSQSAAETPMKPVDVPNPSLKKEEVLVQEPEVIPPPSLEEVKQTLSEMGNLPGIQIDVSQLQLLAGTDFPNISIYRATNSSPNPPQAIFIAFHNGNYWILDTEEGFAQFIQHLPYQIQDKDIDDIVGLISSYHRVYLKMLARLEDIPEEARFDPRLEGYGERIMPPMIHRPKEDSAELHVWAYNPLNQSLEELILHQYQDWPLTMESKNLEVGLKSVDAKVEESTEASFQSASEQVEEPPAGGKLNIPLIITLVVLVIAAIVGAILFLM